MQAGIVRQCHQFHNQRAAHRDDIDQVTPTTGCIFGKGEYVTDRFGGTELQKILELPFEGVPELGVFDALRALELEDLILFQGKYDDGVRARKALVGNNRSQGGQPSGGRALGKTGL